MLEEAGIKNAKALLGGYGAWTGAGYPIVKGDQPK
jgi:rhodanese-related sulfurtransferase